jgi:TM2 domain-containing membrane protein YozV
VAGRALERILPRESTDRVIYGVILVGALLAAEGGVHETYLDTILSAVIATAIYWLAHSYAGPLARRLTRHDRLTVGALWRGLAQEATLIRDAAIPVLVPLIAWAIGVTQASAVAAALWSSLTSLISNGCWARALPRTQAAPGTKSLLGLQVYPSACTRRLGLSPTFRYIFG